MAFSVSFRKLMFKVMLLEIERSRTSIIYFSYFLIKKLQSKTYYTSYVY